MKPKPRHLGPQYGAQFEDESVALAYHTRPPYPAELFDVLERLLPPGPRRVLDLGCGTGDVALGLSDRVDQIDAVDPSEAMLRVARSRRAAGAARVRWIASSAESFTFEGPYALVVASESLHWMEWPLVIPKIAAALRSGACLAIASGRSLEHAPWAPALDPLFPRYSTNQEYRPYDLVDELIQRELFLPTGRCVTAPIRCEQSLDDYVESFHTRNGFSRERMSAEAANAFDQAVRRIVSPHAADGVVRGDTSATIAWGTPQTRPVR